MIVKDDLIFDVGMHNGDDTDYYLRKGFRVVGIDANPALCGFCEARFRDEIQDGRLTVLNIGVGPEAGKLPFHINQRETQVSTFSSTLPDGDWEVIEASVVRLSDVMEEHGIPAYAKIDIEHYDHLVLDELSARTIQPKYISAEAHTLETFSALRRMGYQWFKLVRGESVPDLFGKHPIRTRDGRMCPFEFQPLSTGPFGEDLPGEWMSPEHLLEELTRIGPGWIDIHARA
jgi:FkbM family methyltransferase